MKSGGIKDGAWAVIQWPVSLGKGRGVVLLT